MNFSKKTVDLPPKVCGTSEISVRADISVIECDGGVFVSVRPVVVTVADCSGSYDFELEKKE